MGMAAFNRARRLKAEQEKRKQQEEQQEDKRQQEEPNIDILNMTDDELAEYAESINVDISRCRSRESAETKVRKREQELGAE